MMCSYSTAWFVFAFPKEKQEVIVIMAVPLFQTFMYPKGTPLGGKWGVVVWKGEAVAFKHELSEVCVCAKQRYAVMGTLVSLREGVHLFLPCCPQQPQTPSAKSVWRDSRFCCEMSLSPRSKQIPPNSF